MFGCHSVWQLMLSVCLTRSVVWLCTQWSAQSLREEAYNCAHSTITFSTSTLLRAIPATENNYRTFLLFFFFSYFGNHVNLPERVQEQYKPFFPLNHLKLSCPLSPDILMDISCKQGAWFLLVENSIKKTSSGHQGGSLPVGCHCPMSF